MVWYILIQYRLHPEPLQQIAGWIAQIEAQWDAKLQALHHHLMQQETTMQQDEASEHYC